MVSGTKKNNESYWLPTLSNIALPHMGRKYELIPGVSSTPNLSFSQKLPMIWKPSFSLVSTY